MRTLYAMMLIVSTALLFSCGQQQAENTQSTGELENALDPKGGQAAVADESSQKNILHVALGSKDHTTLVAAVQAAAYENALVNAGPFTVFAPTDQAFGALPAGTVDELVKPENQLKLQDILEYHVYIGNLSAESLTEGRVLGMANGGKVTCANDNGTVTVNGAKIVASVPCSNGIVHVVDKVLLPQ